MKIALVGSAGSIAIAPYENTNFAEFREGLPTWPPLQWAEQNWQVWGCSPGAAFAVRRATRWFEVHRWEPGQPWFSQAYCQFLRDFQGPVYTNPVEPPKDAIPNGVPFPIGRVEDEFTSYFLTSSLALMAGLAILEIEDQRRSDPNHNREDDEIGFFGVDMAANEEWASQRPGCHFFILEALKRGIGIYVPPESCLLRPQPIYGISESYHAYIKMTARSRELNSRITAAMKQRDEAIATIHSLGGAQDDLGYMVNTWVSPYGLPSGVTVRLKPGSEHLR